MLRFNSVQVDRNNRQDILRGINSPVVFQNQIDITADIITIAKGLTSAYAPLSGSIVSDRIWKVMEQGTDELGPIGHGWTYSAHPICAAAGVANLKLIDALGLVGNAAKTGAHFNSAMSE